MVQWLGYLALTQVARVRFPVSESFLPASKIIFHQNKVGLCYFCCFAHQTENYYNVNVILIVTLFEEDNALQAWRWSLMCPTTTTFVSMELYCSKHLLPTSKFEFLSKMQLNCLIRTIHFENCYLSLYLNYLQSFLASC